MPSTILVTGFPGLLANALLPRIVARNGATHTITCIVERDRMTLAEATLRRLDGQQPGVTDRVRLYEGDIGEPDLGVGIGRLNYLKGAIREVFHLAAVYDLAVDAATARRVNVAGTRHLLNLATKAGKLQRFHHVSTCYVSGAHDGEFRETDFGLGQRFNNHYEASKFNAERLVRDAMGGGVPATIYRPSIVVGDSETGETGKYDGLYHVLQWMLRLPSWFPFPDFGGLDEVEVNVVPRDVVVNAIDELGARDSSEGTTYHLCDSEPPTVRELLQMVEGITGQRLQPVRVPARWTARLASGLPGLRGWVRIPLATFAYFTHPTRYGCDLTREELESMHLELPTLADTLPALIGYMLEHPETR